MNGERAEERQLLRDVEAAARARFGRHVAFKIYCDTSDAAPNEFDACLHHRHEPAGGKSWIMFPHNDEVITRGTKLEALQGLLDAIRKV